MKKVLFSLIALMAVMTVQAQSICATWRSMQPVVETADDGTFTAQNLTYTFNDDGTFYFVDELTMASQPAKTMAQEVAACVEYQGTYTLDGDKLTLKPNMNTYKTDVISISKNGRVVKDANLKSKVNTQLNSRDFKNRFAQNESCTVKVGEASMEMNNSYFVRFATIKK